jgi:ribosomal protein L11 methyltransferase
VTARDSERSREGAGRASGSVATRPSWVEVTVEASAEVSEAASAILHELRSGGIVEERRPRGRCRFRYYLPPSRLLPITLRAIRARLHGLRAFGLNPGSVRVVHRRVRGRRWTTAWRRYVPPVRVGPVWVRPSWVRVRPPAGSVVLDIDPGMAFGTGLHPSTQLCLRALLQTLPRRDRPRVFDTGTGSGILAIAAARLGAAQVWAIDNDPVAVAVARENVRRNRVAEVVRVVRGDGLTPVRGQADVILMNIVAGTVIELLPAARGRLRTGGACIASGIVAGRVRDVLRAARRAGFRHRRTLRSGEWRAVVLEPAS